MQLSYRHANPYSGRESTLLQFEDLLPDRTVTVLIDAGEGVDVDSMLVGEEYLGAICLTHAHLDHYATLGANCRDGAPVYAAPDTAAILEDVYAAGEDHYDHADSEAAVERLEPIDAWTRIVEGLFVRPVPAGHAPGAAGFLFAVRDGDAYRTILATGDFTRRPAAGNRGLPAELPVDVLLLTGATNDSFEGTATAVVERITERARAGSTVLATAGGLTGVTLAYWLGHYFERTGAAEGVTLVGHLAKLYDRLGHDVPRVESVPVFEDPGSVLADGRVAVAGPEVPVEGSAGRLFDALEGDPNGTLVQVTGGATDPTTTGRCTVDDFAVSNHPSRAAVDDLVASLDPVHVVVTHQQGGDEDRFVDHYDSYVWATDDSGRHLLFDETGWTPPPWVGEGTVRRVESSTKLTGHVLGDLADGAGPAPALERRAETDLAAEGLDLDALDERFRTSVGGGRDATSDAAGGSEPRGSPVDATDETVVADGARVGPEADESRASDRPAPDRAEGEPVAGDVVGDRDARLARIESSLERIESSLDGGSTDATVVDAGDGVVLLRLTDPPADLAHGDEVRVSLRGIGDGS